MADNVIGIKFGVAGGKSFIAGSSGALIKEQLEYLASKVKLKVDIDKSYLKNQLLTIKKEIDNTFGSLNINVNNNANAVERRSSDRSNVNKQLTNYEAVINTLDRLYQVKAKLIKLPKNDASVVAVKANGEVEELTVQYEKQYEELKKLEGIDSQRTKNAKEYKALLERTYQAQAKASENAKEQSLTASPTASAKLKSKSASLFVDNGFDKIIARSKEAKGLVENFAKSVNDALDQKGGATKQQIEQLNTGFLQTQARLKEITRETKTVGGKIREAFDSRVIQRVAQVLLLAVARALRQIFQNVKEIDAAMTELRIITRATSTEMDKAAKSIAKSAKEIGASLVDLTKSTSVYARLGFGMAEAEILAKKTTMYAKISGVNIDQATTNITGIIKAYNIGAEGLEAVLDQLIWVGNTFSISQAEIGEAMNNAASSLEANGNSLQEAIGIVTAANASLQNVSKSSTAVRTIAARISRSTAELQELGEDVGSVLATADLDAKMRAFGVSIMGANGELRSTYDILNDLAKNWDNFNDVERAAITEMVAGVRQQNAFYSIMNNWKDAEKVVANAAQGVGSLNDAQEIYLDSIEGKTNQLKASWEEFSKSILDSDIVKFFVELLSVVANVLNAIISFGDGLVAKGALAAGAVIGLMAVFKKLSPIISSARLQFHLLQMELGVAGTGLKGFAAAAGTLVKEFLAKNSPILVISTLIALMSSLSGQSRGWAELLVGAISLIVTAIIIGVKGVDATIKGFMASNPIGWIMLVVTAFIAVVKGIADLVEAFNPSFKSLKEAAKESADAWKTAKDELSSVTDKLGEIQKKIDSINKEKLTIADKKELEFLENQKKELEAIQAAKQNEEERAKQKAADDAAKALGKYNDTRTIKSAPWYEWLLIGPWAGIHEGISAASDTYEEKFNKIIKNYNSASQKDKDFISATLQEYGKLLEGFSYGDNAELDKHFIKHFKMIDMYNLQTGNADKTWGRVFADSRFSDEVKKLQQLADMQGVTMDSILSAAPQFIAYLKEIGLYTDNDVNSSNALIESIKKLRKGLEAKTKIEFNHDLEVMQDKFDSLSNALSDIDKTGIISMDNISKIIDKDAEGYPALLQKYFKYVNGVGYQLADSWKGKSKSEILSNMARDEIKAYADEVSKAQEILNGMTADNEDYNIALDNVATTQENLNTKITEWATILREQALEEEAERLKGVQESIEKQADKYKELIDIRKDLLQSFKDEISYQKELAKKQKNVADLQTQLSLASLDKSAAGQAKARELQEQLNNAQDELDEYTLERAIKDLTQQLDNDYDAYKNFIQCEVDRILETIKNLASEFKITLTPNSDGSVEVESHHSGGFVGNLISLKSNEEFAKLLTGEFVATPRQMDEFMRKTLPNFITYGSAATINNNSPLIEIRCGNIDNNVLPQLNNLVNEAVSRIEKNMESALSRTGYKKKY